MKSKFEIIIKNTNIFIIILIKLYIIFLIKNIKNNYIKIKNKYINKTINISNYNFTKINNLKNLSFKTFLINYTFSLKYKIAKIEYNIEFYKEKHNLVIPSHLTRYHHLHILCLTHDIKRNISIFSMAAVVQNKFYKCVEFVNMNDNVKFGLSIYYNNNHIEYFHKFLFESKVINYDNLIFLKESEYDPFLLLDTFQKIKNRITLENLKLKESYYKKPNFIIKLNLTPFDNKTTWQYENIYNYHFCFYNSNNISNFSYNDINQKCKYYFYLNIIDNNRYIYNKTNYLFSDFSSSNTATGEAFLIFNEMNAQNLDVHFMTKREDIYNNFSNYNLTSKNQIIFDFLTINGNFLEKYLDIILKLKSTISGAKIYSINNLFFNIEYITYICLGHGISYFKDFLYKNYYSYKTYDKILLPNSNMIISNAKNFGWKEKDIIKIGLPRWDFFDCDNIKLRPFQNQSIFAMFTWRELKKDKSISKYYFKNILEIFNNIYLNSILKENNIIIYFSLHHMLEKYKFLFNINKNIKYINQNQILECMNNSDLIITDFSSVIFDFIYRNKPYIIFLPDSKDSDLKNIYTTVYYNKINYLRNGSSFKNRFFEAKDTINKIIYYINNNFELDLEMKNFYKYINLKKDKNINNFINYLKIKT